MIQKLLIAIVVVAVLLVMTRFTIQFLSAERVATGLMQDDNGKATLSGCDGLFNCTSSTATQKQNRIDPIKYTSAEPKVIEKLAALIDEQPGTKIINKTPDYLHATFKTRLLGYTDDLEVLLIDNKHGTRTLHVRSASRIGRSDLGANRKRIESFREIVRDKI